MSVFYESQGFTVSLAGSAAEVQEAQRLRHAVFVDELGAPDQGSGLEADTFDAYCDHLILRKQDEVAPVAVTRVMDAAQAAQAGSFYSETEFDLTRLRQSGRALLELGRTCVRSEHRSGTAMFHLWAALADFVTRRGIEVMFGTASLPGADLADHHQTLSLLHHDHLAPPPLRTRSIGEMIADWLPKSQINRADVVVKMPALIKAYLRLGGVVGGGAFADKAFNCTDVLMILDVETMNARTARRYRSRG